MKQTQETHSNIEEFKKMQKERKEIGKELLRNNYAKDTHSNRKREDYHSLDFEDMEKNRIKKDTHEEDFYIAKINKNGIISVRTKYRQTGYVKISKPSEKEIEEYFTKQENFLKQEIELIKRAEELQKSLNKLRSMRDGRKRGM